MALEHRTICATLMELRGWLTEPKEIELLEEALDYARRMSAKLEEYKLERNRRMNMFRLPDDTQQIYDQQCAEATQEISVLAYMLHFTCVGKEPTGKYPAPLYMDLATKLSTDKTLANGIIQAIKLAQISKLDNKA